MVRDCVRERKCDMTATRYSVKVTLELSTTYNVVHATLVTDLVLLTFDCLMTGGGTKLCHR